MKRGILLNFAVMVLALLMCFVALEVGVRVWAPQYKKIFQYHELVGVRRIPNSTFKVFTPTAKLTHRANSDGYTTPEVSINKPPRTFRVVLLGDSMTEAIQLPGEAILRSRLEEKLSQELGQSVEVINLGYSGYGTAQEYLAYMEFGRKYEPDLVILNFLADNDVANNSQKLEFGPSKPFFEIQNSELVLAHRPRKDAKGKLMSFVTDYLVLPRFLYLKFEIAKARWQASRGGRSGESDTGLNIRDQVYYEDYDDAWQEAWDITTALIRKLNEQVTADGAKFLVLSFPVARQTVPEVRQKFTDAGAQRGVPVDTDKPEELLRQRLLELGIRSVSLLEIFASHPRLQEFYLEDDWHFSAAGHEFVAAHLTEYLKENNLSP